VELRRCAWRNGWGESAAKIGRGKVRGCGAELVAVAIVCVCVMWEGREYCDLFGFIWIEDCLELELLGRGASV
jgi:hypothetical protein